jgi:predicted DNA-binding protein (UPF0251 family)
MKTSSQIKKYKKAVESLSVNELLTALNNSRLTADEKFAIELTDIYQVTNKEASVKMNTDERQLGRWLHSGRIKILKQIFK